MSVREVMTETGDDILTAAGVASLQPLLDPEADLAMLPGQWSRLDKAGLGGRQRWRWEVDTPHGARTLYVKRYFRTPLRSQLDRIWRQRVRHSRAAWEFQQAEHLAEQYVAAAPAIAMIEEMKGPLERRSAVVLGAVEGEAFDRAWRRLEADGAPVTRTLARHELTERLGRFVAAFHQTGCCHRDLYLCHVFAALDPAGVRPPHFSIIDLARVHMPHLRKMRWIVKDLAQLDYSATQIGASRTDRLRFLLAYLGLQRGSQRVRYYVRRVVRKSHAIRQREVRKGRA